MPGRGLQIGSAWGWQAWRKHEATNPLTPTLKTLWLAWWFGASSGAVALAGAATETVSATGAVTQTTPLAGAATEMVSATGGLDISAPSADLAGAASAAVTARAHATVHDTGPVEYNNPIVWVSPGGFWNMAGAFFDYTEYAPEQNTLFATKAKTHGKWYIEFNCAGDLAEVRYYFGFVSPAHGTSRTGPMPGFSADSWSLSTNGGDAYHDSSATDLGFPFSLLAIASALGFYYDYDNYFLNDGGIMRWAVDFDAGKLWAGYYDYDNGHDTWNGDPSAGTSPTYTFTPNTPLIPAVGIHFYNGTLLSTGFGCLGAHRGNYRAAPPAGFRRWEEFAHQAEVLADAPSGYWMAGPSGNGWPLNSIGMTAGEADSSGNRRFAEHYNSASYALLVAAARRLFPAQPAVAWWADGANTRYSKYPCSLSAASSRSFEASIEITGAGATNNSTWKGGSGICCNHVSASQAGSFTLSDLWFGLSLRDRRLKFGVGASEVTSSADLANGVYHVACVLDVGAGTLTLYVNGSPDNQASGYTAGGQGASYLAIGSMRPDQTNGHFPGYIRDVALYPSALPAARVAAHYQNLLVAPLPRPIGRSFDERTLRFPYQAT